MPSTHCSPAATALLEQAPHASGGVRDAQQIPRHHHSFVDFYRLPRFDAADAVSANTVNQALEHRGLEPSTPQETVKKIDAGLRKAVAG